MWQPATVDLTGIFTKIGEVQLQSDDQLSVVNDTVSIATVILTGNNTIEVQSGDVVGYYHPPDARFRVITRRTDGYILQQFNASGSEFIKNYRQPLIQFTISKCEQLTS